MNPDRLIVGQPARPEEHLHDLIAGNQRKAQELAGMQASISPQAVMAARLNTFIEFLLGEDPERRTAFEIQFETLMSTVFDGALSERRRHGLLNGVGPEAQRLLVPPAR